MPSQLHLAAAEHFLSAGLPEVLYKDKKSKCRQRQDHWFCPSSTWSTNFASSSVLWYMTGHETFTSDYFHHPQIKLEKAIRWTLSAACSPWTFSCHGVSWQGWTHGLSLLSVCSGSQLVFGDSSLSWIVAQDTAVPCVRGAVHHVGLHNVIDCLFLLVRWAPMK